MSDDAPPLGSYAPADIPWAEITARLGAAVDYWLATTRPEGRPHTVPIWGVWQADAFYFYTEPQTQKVRNLTAQPEVVVHLESANDVVIVEGSVAVVPASGEEWRQVDQAFFTKYRDPRTGGGLRLAALRDPIVYRLRPGHVRAWLRGNSFAQSHWRFADPRRPAAPTSDAGG